MVLPILWYWLARVKQIYGTRANKYAQRHLMRAFMLRPRGADGDRPRLGRHQLGRSGLVWRAEVGERGEQVVVRSYIISCHLSICEDGNEAIHNVIGEFPAIPRVGRRPCGIIKEDVRQQSFCHPRCFLWGIPPRVLQGVREDSDETGIVLRLRSDVDTLLITGKEYRLRRERAAVRRDPFPTLAVHSAMPQAHLSSDQGRGGYFQHDAADVLFGEEIVTGELEIVQGSHRVEEKGIAAPAGEEAVVPGFRHLCIPPRRDWRSFVDGLPAVARSGGLYAFNTAQGRSLRPALAGREAHTVCDIGDEIAVHVNLKFIDRVGRKGLVCRGPGRIHSL